MAGVIQEIFNVEAFEVFDAVDPAAVINVISFMFFFLQ